MGDSKKNPAEKQWHKIFEFGILLKAINGTLELISSLVILFTSQATFLEVFLRLSRGELIKEPNDRFIAWVTFWLQHISSDTKTFAAIYILLHGIINIYLAIQLYREKIWAYKLAIGFILVFMFYQIYRITLTHSLVLMLITIWDVVFIGVIWHEYKRKSHLLLNKTN